MDPAVAAADPTVVSARHSGRETALLVRRDGAAPPAGWRAEPVSLEELVLAYLENPAAGAPPPRVVEAAS
jgi:ABC-2 type transport system ATP-binding protein